MDYDIDSDHRLSLLGMEIPELDSLGHAPVIAAPAAVGYGPTVAMPTLIGMMPSIDDFEDDEGEEEGSNAPDTQVKLRVKSPGVRTTFVYINNNSTIAILIN